MRLKDTSARPVNPQATGATAGSRWPQGHPRRKQILLVLCLSLLAGVIDNTVLNTALPTLARVLHAGTSSLQWIVDAYTLCFAALLIPAGALGDRYGRRASLVGGLSVFALGSLAAALAPTAGVLILDRVVMGFGAAFIMPATLSILNAVFPPRERAQAIAAWSAVAGVGVIVGPTLGGLLLAHFWWGSVFLVNVPIVVVALAGVLFVVPETAEPGRRSLDVVGTVLVGGALVALVDAIIEAPIRGWTGIGTLAEAGAGLATLAIFVWWELRVPHPLIDLRIFSSRAFSAASGSITVTFFALFGSLFVFTQYLQLVHGYSPLSAGVRALPFAFATGAISPLSPMLATRLGNRFVVSAGLALMGLGLLDLSTARVDSGYPALALAVRDHGSRHGTRDGSGQLDDHDDGASPPSERGSAVNDTIREVGGTLGVAIVGSLTAAVYRSRLSAKLAAHHTPGFVVRIATGSIAAADAVAGASAACVARRSCELHRTRSRQPCPSASASRAGLPSAAPLRQSASSPGPAGHARPVPCRRISSWPRQDRRTDKRREVRRCTWLYLSDATSDRLRR